jgi:aldehyde dehydrogenase (NAD+)
MGLIEPLAPALAMGNRVTAVASQAFPLAATDFYQVLETSDVPAGVANILTGSHADLAPHMAAHANIDAVWSFSTSDVSKVIEANSAANLKRTWDNNATQRTWTSSTWRAQSTEVKTIWIPYGE